MTSFSYFSLLLAEIHEDLLWPYSSAYHGFFIPLLLAVISLCDLRSSDPHRIRRIVFTLAYSLFGLLLYFLIAPFFASYLGKDIAGHLLLLVLLIIFGLFFSNLSPSTRVVVGAAMFSEINWVLTIVHMILFFYVDLRTANLIQLIMMLSAFTIVRLFRPPEDDKSPAVYWLIMLLIAVISFVALLAVRIFESVDYGAGTNFITIRIILPAFAVVSLLIYVMYSILTHEHRKLDQITALQIRQAHDMEQYKHTEALTKELHSMRHELKNHFTAMKIMLQEQQYDKLLSYFDEILGQNAVVLDAFQCANPLVSALISNAIDTAAASGVRLRAVAAVPESLPIADSDLFSLLSNLISNGVEGCQHAPKKNVTLSMHTEKDYLFINVSNAVSEDFRLNNPRLLTTKRDPAGHGYGIPIIRKIADKYNGCVTFSVENGLFSADVMLCLEES